ncbi:MAG: hypothetical protein Q9163_002180 [Psora crenata]
MASPSRSISAEFMAHTPGTDPWPTANELSLGLLESKYFDLQRLFQDATSDDPDEDSRMSQPQLADRADSRPKVENNETLVSVTIPGYEAGEEAFTIKEEYDFTDIQPFASSQVIEISDDENDSAAVKLEPEETPPFQWIEMASSTISISDAEEECISDKNGIKSSTAIEGQPDVQFLWSNMKDDCIDLEEIPPAKQIMGKSVLDPTLKTSAIRVPMDKAKMAICQRMLAEKALGRPLHTQRFGFPQTPPTVHEQVDVLPDNHSNDDDDSWMTREYKGDEVAAAEFRDLKEAYEAKKAADENTLEDGLEFARAQRIEATRIKRLRIEYERNVGVQNGEDSSSENELFLTTSHTRKCKRAPTTVDVDASDEGILPTTTKRRKHNSANQKGKAKDIEEELEVNMLAGIEHYLRRLQSKDKDAEDNNAGYDSATPPSKNIKKGRGPLKKASVRKSKSRKQPGYLTDIRSLLTSNVFDDATNNRATNAKTLHMEKDKDKFLSALVAGLPNNDSRRSEKNHIKECTVKLGRYRVKPAGNGEDWAVKGMKSALRHHQVQGAAFMKDRENGLEEPYGGINADAMGLGKTVETIALMVCNPPGPSDKAKSTLIVVQPGLLQQWYDELKRHTDENTFQSVIVYHGGHRLAGKGILPLLERADVVLTTYQEVVRSYPKAEIPTGINSVEQLQHWWKSIWAEDCDLLHKAYFYRVVLDESQAIKNHLSLTSIACRALMAKHRWALSGTPIMNRLEELFPYFKFLRITGTGSYSEFQEMYCLESDDCKKRLVTLLNNIMVRRTNKDKILGRPIIELPPFSQETQRLDFNIVERTVYDIIIRRFIRAINKASAKGDLDKKPGYGILMFLRLRQMTAHTFLIQEILQDMFELDSIDRLEKATIHGPEDEHGKAIITALRRLVEAKGSPAEEFEDSGEPEAQPGGLALRLGAKIRQLKREGKMTEVKEEVLCHKCKGPAEVPWVTSCLHIYCKECLEFLAYDACQKHLDKTPCRECGTSFANSEPCGDLQELQIDNFTDIVPNLAARRDPHRKVVMKWVDYEDKLVLSTKTKGVRSQLIKWLAEDPDKKIIVFSQFHMM